MSAGKNYDVQTVSKYVGGVSSHVALGSSVAAGKKRYVTMLRIDNDATISTKGSKVYICSTAASGTAANTATASAAQKMMVLISSSVSTTKEFQSTAKINTENPLFSIAASKWLSAYLSSIAGQSSPVNIFCQYYDQ